MIVHQYEIQYKLWMLSVFLFCYWCVCVNGHVCVWERNTHLYECEHSHHGEHIVFREQFLAVASLFQTQGQEIELKSSGLHNTLTPKLSWHPALFLCLLLSWPVHILCLLFYLFMVTTLHILMILSMTLQTTH